MLCFYLSMVDTENDRDKLITIYNKYHRDMLKIANSITKDSELAQDAVQEAFIRVINNLQKINICDNRKTKSFLFIIVKNCALTIINQNNREKSVDFQEEEAKYAQYMTSDHSVNQFKIHELTSFIQTMPNDYADCLVLKHVMGYSSKEIAVLLGTSESTVSRRLTSATNMLGEFLERRVPNERRTVVPQLTGSIK